MAVAADFYAQASGALSQPRIETYRLRADEERGAVFGRYLWNVALGEALSPCLHFLEVGLRNRLDAAISAIAGVDWYDDPNVLVDQRSRDRVGPDLTLFEVNEAAEIIHQAADSEANIIFGAVIDDRMTSEVKISVIATGFDATRPLKRIEQPIHKRTIEPRAVERTPVAVATNGAGEKADEKRYDPNDLEVPSFLRRR